EMMELPNCVLVAIVDHGLGSDAVLILLDDRGLVARLALPDHGTVTITVAVAISMRLAHGDAGADRAHAHADIVGEHRGRDRAGHGRGQQILLHGLPPVCLRRENARLNSIVPQAREKSRSKGSACIGTKTRDAKSRAEQCAGAFCGYTLKIVSPSTSSTRKITTKT